MPTSRPRRPWHPPANSATPYLMSSLHFANQSSSYGPMTQTSALMPPWSSCTMVAGSYALMLAECQYNMFMQWGASCSLPYIICHFWLSILTEHQPLAQAVPYVSDPWSAHQFCYLVTLLDYFTDILYHPGRKNVVTVSLKYLSPPWVKLKSACCHLKSSHGPWHLSFPYRCHWVATRRGLSGPGWTHPSVWHFLQPAILNGTPGLCCWVTDVLLIL